MLARYPKRCFVSGKNDSNVEGERSPIPKVERCFQEVFDRESVRKLVLAYESGQTLFSVREQIGDDKPWTVAKALRPADRVAWVLEIVASLFSCKISSSTFV
ncbi:MAG: hypothetical protein IGR92_01210 [Leptolyngbyaceae cyanobacterium T60_A2020_046]|nr:hypothetical protein [Leptolyngbyaceae cyanobacterium T60_A2020_046]